MLATTVKPSLSAGGYEPPKHACSVCTRRKVKCDKGKPCSNCRKTQAQCVYEAAAPRRPRKRAADDDLLTRLAMYEDLMRQNNIDFSCYAQTWVPTMPELILKESESQSGASMISSRAPSVICPPKNDTTKVVRYLWFTLNSELKYPPLQSLRRKDDPFLHPTPPLQFEFPNGQPGLHELHPEPKYIFRLWQIFVERVHPITKIVHAPTLQQRILEASWNTSKASKSLTAIMFVIYTIAITPMSSADCQASFSEAKDVLLTRYRAATLRALFKADFLTTKELEILQAFVLFLLSDPESEFTSIMAGAAMKLGQRMGLYRHNTDPRVSFFEKEMRIRLWWHLRCIDARSRAVCTPGSSPPLESEFGDVRLPLNVNDADLHPDMVDPPIEHNSPTEMLCVLLKLEVFNWLRSSLKASKVFDNIIHGPARGKMSVGLEDGRQAINELAGIYHNEYIRNCDHHIPLHSMARIIAMLSLARMRFKLLHPRWRAAFGGGEVHFTREEIDTLFDSAETGFALAWKLVEDLYNGHPELVEDADNTFFVALGDLTVEAWEARRKALVSDRESREFVTTPQFIRLLWDKREKQNLECGFIAAVSSAPDFDSLGLTDEIDLNWDYWKDFLHL